MNRDSYLTVLLAICCIGATGMASTTLASSLTEDPDDVVDFDYSKLPIGQDDGESVRGAVQNREGDSPQGGSDQQTTSTPQGESNEGDEEESSSQNQDSKRDSQESTPGAGDATGGDTNDEKGESGGSQGTAASGSGGSGQTPGLSLLDRLLLLLQQLLPLLLLLIAAALAYRYRRNLLALAMAVAAVFGDRTPDREQPTTNWPSEQPSNEIHRAWLAMVDQLDIDRPHTRTPSECAKAAVEANMDPTAVQTLTNVFEEVRYGEKPVTDERKQRARKGLQEIRGGGVQ